MFLFVFFYDHPYLDFCFFFFFNDTATTEIYTLSLHDALPISSVFPHLTAKRNRTIGVNLQQCAQPLRSEEHTSELQSQSNLVCRLLLEKKKKTNDSINLRKFNILV